MENRHDDLVLNDVVEEQQVIDGLINSLLSFTATSTSNLGEQHRRKSVESAGMTSTSSRSSNSPSAQSRKGRGRPSKVTVPPSTPAPSSPAQNLSLETIVECMKKLNEQNKKLIKCVEVLSEKVNKSGENAAISPSEEGPKTVLEGVTERLEKIENNLNSNILFCRGPTVESLITENSNEATPPNLERLKGEVCRAVCGDQVTGVDISSVNLSLLGKEKKFIKLDCRNPSSKLHLLKQARKNKPQGIFVSDFLTKAKLNIFYNLRQLKKQYPEKIKSAFSKGGNIYYKLHNSSETLQVTSLSDLEKIPLPAPVNSSVTEGGD